FTSSFSPQQVQSVQTAVHAMEKKENKNKKKPNKKGPGNEKNSNPKKIPDVSGGITEPKGFSKGKPKPKDKKPKNGPKDKVSAVDHGGKPVEILPKPVNMVKSDGLQGRQQKNSISEPTWDNNPDYNHTDTGPKRDKFNTDNSKPSSSTKHCDTTSRQFSTKFFSQSVLENLERFQSPDDISEVIAEIEAAEDMSKKQVPVMCLDPEEEEIDPGDQFMIDDLPPVFPDVEKLLEDLNIGGLDELSIHDFNKHLKFWKPKVQLDDLFDWTMASDATTLEAKRNPITGELIEFCEVPISGQELTAKNSMSWERAPEPFDEENITGHSTNKPFWPGGFAEPEDMGDTLLEDVDLDFKNNLLVDPPGYYGLNFQPDGRTLRDLDK
ncbi:uncharacterized protein LOC103517298, partial [Diaphorina citri]|uniref:Uncharacterized protein LOC103517298 n=1 Tax=Diaphorina citri TaxID=121845 RepID=A0A1S3DGI9_DIACI